MRVSNDSLYRSSRASSGSGHWGRGVSSDVYSDMAGGWDKGEILASKALSKYILETNAYPREHEQLKELRQATVQKYQIRSIMNVPADEGQLISMMLKLMNAKKAIEIGVFTGYSLLTTALALPADGKIIAIDRDKEAYETGLPFIRKAGVDHKIDFIQSDAFSFLNDLVMNSKEEGTFDFAFVDAKKDDYMKYHELVLKLVKVGGMIRYDDTLWYGAVALSEADEMDDHQRLWRAQLREFNSFLAKDPRIECCLLSIGGGLTLCRRLH
ncbi:hypothetical protein BT93_H3369 [Corymbia citriodora subsp. variegata]|nr:hypothetical protein BT93_H3369 [Corymbia citriodora subsp. variegata]